MSYPTPICDFVRRYRDAAPLRAHMPGHKGQGILGVEALDITEVDGADVLYHSGGIIRQSEELAASLFHTARTVYSAEGSSLAIRAMLYLTLLWAKKHHRAPVIAAGRNAHRTFLQGCALLGLEPAWLFPESVAGLVSCLLTPEGLERQLSVLSPTPCAVYVTSPDYLGNSADIAGLATVAHRHGALLLVDNAHGAYLSFLPPFSAEGTPNPQHPMALGADLCCDSAHKTLPVLTGGAYLHIARQAPTELIPLAETAMALFASTSPSYLILQSLDACNRYLAEDFPSRLTAFLPSFACLKAHLLTGGWTLVGTEPFKLTLSPKSRGYRGDTLAAYLRTQGIECEFADPDYVVLMLTPALGENALSQIEKALTDLPPQPAISELPPLLPRSMCRLSVRDAMLSLRETLPIETSIGRILADPAVSCPPAVPILVSGEEITEQAVVCAAYYGLREWSVVR